MLKTLETNVSWSELFQEEFRFNPEEESDSKKSRIIPVIQEIISRIPQKSSGFDVFDDAVDSSEHLDISVGFQKNSNKSVVGVRFSFFDGNKAHPLKIVTIGFSVNLCGVNPFSLTNTELE